MNLATALATSQSAIHRGPQAYASSPRFHSRPSTMAAVFLDILGCQATARAACHRGSARFATSSRQATIFNQSSSQLRCRDPQIRSIVSTVARQRRPGSNPALRQQGLVSTRRSFVTSSFARTPRNTLGRIEPKRIVVEVPRINKFESVWKPILVSRAERVPSSKNSTRSNVLVLS